MAKAIKRSKWPEYLVFIGPAMFFFTLIVIIPFLMSMYYSLTDWNGVSSKATFIGLDNFKKIFMDDDLFRKDFWFTIRFTVVSVLLTNLIGFGLAMLLTRKMKLRNVYRTVFFLPNVIGGLLLGFIWQFIFVKGFATVGELTGIGFFQLPWLGDAATAFWGLVIVQCWQFAGYVMVIYIAALINVPKELIEAAHIDGASKWVMLKQITVPLIMPAFTVCFFLSISWCFKVFDLNLSLTKGGPFNSTESVALNIYYEAFRNNRYGLGTAKAFIFFVIVALVTVLQVMYTKKKEVQA
ncbi:carbohydrate ABC transporter permease [Paenibacillus abyssi]|uniref:ABC transporter permease n=1 Tax=Paenibacillus abyssi TaxID=1340531 RepID=A0A917CR91_9BACL|nr:sugar ABC transporter permease [Paenibacillus abyssi]GGF96227.1 ABC transporter permease [Paenibacillus abyssi]